MLPPDRATRGASSPRRRRRARRSARRCARACARAAAPTQHAQRGEAPASRSARAPRSPTAAGRRRRRPRGGLRGMRATPARDQRARVGRQRARRRARTVPRVRPHAVPHSRSASVALPVARDARDRQRSRRPRSSTASPRAAAPRAAARDAARRRSAHDRAPAAARAIAPAPPRRRRGRPSTARARAWSVAGRAPSAPPACRRAAPRCGRDTRSTSSSLWLMKMIDRPCATICFSVANSASLSCGVSTAVGSSRIRMRAPRYSAFRISTRWRSPTDSSPTSASGLHRQAEALPPRRAAARAPPRRRENGCHSGSVPSITLSSTRQVVGQREVLVHHADAGGQRRLRIARRQRPAERPRSCRRRPRSGRTGSTPASTCRRRSRRAAPAPRRHCSSSEIASLATSAPKRLVMPLKRRTGRHGRPDAPSLPRRSGL